MEKKFGYAAGLEQSIMDAEEAGHALGYERCVWYLADIITDLGKKLALASASASPSSEKVEDRTMPRRWRCPDCGIPNLWDALACVRCRLISPPDKERWEFKPFVRSDRKRLTALTAVTPPASASPHPETLKVSIDDAGDHICQHGTALDVHCCNCHSGFIFDREHECPSMNLSLHRCKICGTRWLLWPDAVHGGGWNVLDKYQRPGSCCDNVAMGDQIEHLRDFPAIPASASPQAKGEVVVRISMSNNAVRYRIEGHDETLAFSTGQDAAKVWELLRRIQRLLEPQPPSARPAFLEEPGC